MHNVLSLFIENSTWKESGENYWNFSNWGCSFGVAALKQVGITEDRIL